MRLISYAFCIGLIAFFAFGALAAEKSASAKTQSSDGITNHIEVTADQSLEWYQKERLYVARGNAKAVRGQMTVEADLLTAHERELPPKEGSASKAEARKPIPPPTSQPSAKPADDTGAGDIDKMTAEGNVRVTTPRSHIFGTHGVYDLNQHVAYLTGDGLKYETEDETVTAKNSLEYWEDKKLAVARGHAIAIGRDRHVEGDLLTAQFRDMPNGKSQLQAMTAQGNVVVITANDVSRADRGVYDINRNIAILTGHVRITRNDGTQLAGDVGEVDFATNQSRLMNEGKGRVRALLAAKTTARVNSGKNETAPTLSPAP
jgi:lipopolysaccharide export system protein LptA